MPFPLSALAAVVAAVSSLGGMSGPDVSVEGVFRAVGGQIEHQAVTFDAHAVPAGGRVAVTEWAGRGGTRVELRIHGVAANRTFGVHVHQKPCGIAPDDSGAHYQNVLDPKQPSTDPTYANPRNEVWLDFTSDRHGDGGSVATVAWRFRAGGAHSVVIHEHATETGPGAAGTAGARIACVNVPFE